jgi:hypothetical protein
METRRRSPIRGPIRYLSLLKIAFAFCILLATPSEIYLLEEYVAEPPSSLYRIASVFMYLQRWQTAGESGFWSSTTRFVEPITLLAAIIIVIPSIYLIRRIRNRPANAPILDLSLAAVFATIILTSYLVNQVPPPPELYRIFQSSPSLTLMNFATLVIVVFIIIPIFSREASLWGAERGIGKKETSRRRIPWPNKYSIAGCLWGFMVCLLPIASIAQIWDSETITRRIDSPLYVISQTIRDAPTPGNVNDWMEISLEILSVFDFLSFLAVSAFQIVFAFFVLRYLRGMINRRRVIQLGILSILAPLLYYLLAALNPEAGVLFAIPIPSVLIGGVIAILVIVPNAPSDNADVLGKEEMLPEHRLEPEIAPDESRVQMPLLYYIKSKLTEFMRGNSKSKDK